MLPAHAVTSAIDEGKVRTLPFYVPAFKRNIAVIFRQNSPVDAGSLRLIEHIEEIGAELSAGFTPANSGPFPVY